MQQPTIRRRSLTEEELEERRTGSNSALAPRQKRDPYDVKTNTSAVRYDTPPVRIFEIPAQDGGVIRVNLRELKQSYADWLPYIDEIEVTPKQLPEHRQRRAAHPNTNGAVTPPVIPLQGRATPLNWRLRAWAGRVLLVIGIGMIIMIVGYILLNMVGNWWTTTQDDWHYGRPRTYQTDYNVGHGTAQDPMSHFIAINLNKKIEVIEIPGNDPAKSQIYIGPTLIGPGEELTPVTLSFEDVNGDGHPDLVIHIADSKFIFLNKKINGVWKFVPAPNQS